MSVTDILNEEMQRQEVTDAEFKTLKESFVGRHDLWNVETPSNDNPEWSPTMRWYHQGALGAYIMRKIRSVTGSVSEALSMMRG